MYRKCLLAICAAASLAAVAPAVFAAHPKITEDTGTQGTGNAELELGFGWARDQDGRVFQFQPQLSYGVTPTLDLIVQPSWLSVTDLAGTRTQGIGDTNFDLKWKFYGDGPFSLGMRTGLTIATAKDGLGLPRGEVSPHVLLVGAADLTPFTIETNLGYARMPDGSGMRTDLYHVSAAVTYAINQKLSLVFDAAIDSNPNPARDKALATGLAAIIYTMRPGFDLDLGYVTRLNSAATVRQWLFGITYRWTP